VARYSRGPTIFLINRSMMHPFQFWMPRQMPQWYTQGPSYCIYLPSWPATSRFQTSIWLGNRGVEFLGKASHPPRLTAGWAHWSIEELDTSIPGSNQGLEMGLWSPGREVNAIRRALWRAYWIYLSNGGTTCSLRADQVTTPDKRPVNAIDVHSQTQSPD
jgi:hypothetical protein